MNPAVLAFKALELSFQNKRINPNDFDLSNLPKKAPLFVTWKRNGELRGCIGTFEPQPLITGVEVYALIAALQDRRFSPIAKEELPELSVTVTLLTPKQPLNDINDMQIGVDGIYAIFDGPQKKTSTFLPEVAEEMQWTPHMTLEMLAQKAGATSLENVKLQKYQGIKYELTYKDYIASQ